jgi:hypothetical protein
MHEFLSVLAQDTLKTYSKVYSISGWPVLGFSYKTNIYKTLVSRYSVHSQKTWLLKSQCLPCTVKSCWKCCPATISSSISGRCLIKMLSASYQWVGWLEELLLNSFFPFIKWNRYFRNWKGQNCITVAIFWVSHSFVFEYSSVLVYCAGQVFPIIPKEFGASIFRFPAVEKQWLFLG